MLGYRHRHSRFQISGLFWPVIPLSLSLSFGFTRRMVEELRQEALDRPSEAARLSGSGHVFVGGHGFPVVPIVAQTLGFCLKQVLPV